MKEAKIYCDRCRKEIKHHLNPLRQRYSLTYTVPDSQTFDCDQELYKAKERDTQWAKDNIGSVLVVHYDNLIWEHSVHWDLCPDCSKELDKFLKGEN